MTKANQTKIHLGIITLALTLGAEARAEFCADRDFVTVDRPAVDVTFLGMGYSPRCLRVKSGTRVTLPASPVHPLQGVQAPGGPANPFRQSADATSPRTRTLTAPGRYPYFCTRHGDAGGGGMAGEILAE